MAETQKQMASNSLNDFIDQNRCTGSEGPGFSVIFERILRVDVDGKVWINLGSAIAHYGDLKFRRLPAFKTKNLSELMVNAVEPLVSAEGKGQLYCAHHGGHLRTVRLSGQSLNVSGDELLAFEDTLDFEMFMVEFDVSVTSGGLFGVKLSGEGSLAIAMHGDPLVLPVTPEAPLFTDPHATVAWTEGLKPTLKTDITWRTLLLHGGGETFQMQFEGDGFVVVQPSQDPLKFDGKKLKKLIVK